MLQRLGAGVLASGLMAFLMKFVVFSPASQDTAQALSWQTMPLFTVLNQPDPFAEGVMHQYLQVWGTKGATEASQGVWIQSGLTKLADNQGKVPLPAASLTKIATSLATLQKWGPNHQFETLVSATGPIKNGVLQGDLVITGGSDPLFVWQEAIALGNTLNQMGIRRVAGNLIIEGDFYMNHTEVTASSAQFLRQALNSSTWARDAVYSYSLMPPKTPKPQVVIAGGIKLTTYPIPKKLLLIRHQSLPLAQILKEMNLYSNNVMAEILAKSVGGAQVTAQLAANSASVPLAEIQLINGSGLGVDNRISPRAVTAMLMAIDSFLQPYQLEVGDVFPVSGRDTLGTMYRRHMPIGTAMKTGTLRDVSALAGFVPTRDRGRIWFAIINRGNDVLGFRTQQDQFLIQLAQQWGSAITGNVKTAQSPPLPPYGDPNRNQKVFGIETQL